jgi:hypothetical protein
MDYGRPIRTLVQEMNISIIKAARFMVLEDLRDKSYVIRRGQSWWRQARGRRTGSRRTSRRCDKEVWPPSSPDCILLDDFMWGVSEL